MIGESDVHATATPLNRLRPAATDPQGTPPTPEAHAGCAGHAAQGRVVRRAWDRGREPEAVTDFYCLDPAAHAPRYGHSRPGAAAGRADR